MYRKAVLSLLGYDTLAILLMLVGVCVGIPPVVVYLVVAAVPAMIVGFGIIPLLGLLVFAILATPDDPQVKSENLRRCRGLLLLALLGFLPAVSLPFILYVTSIFR